MWDSQREEEEEGEYVKLRYREPLGSELLTYLEKDS